MNSTHIITAVQFLAPLDQARVSKLVESRAKRNPRFRARLMAAKAKALAEERQYDEWLCEQEAARAALIEEDITW